jgi:hypothetical protein
MDFSALASRDACGVHRVPAAFVTMANAPLWSGNNAVYTLDVTSMRELYFSRRVWTFRSDADDATDLLDQHSSSDQGRLLTDRPGRSTDVRLSPKSGSRADIQTPPLSARSEASAASIAARTSEPCTVITAGSRVEPLFADRVTRSISPLRNPAAAESGLIISALRRR